MPGQPFPVSPHYTQISLAYRNPAFIADRVMPRTPVLGQTFKYMQHAKAEPFTPENTLVGRTGTPNQVEYSATELPASVEAHGLAYMVPQEDLDAARGNQFNFDPLANATTKTTEKLMLSREIRVAGLVFGAANYAATNRVTLSGTAQWNDYVNSDPVAAILGVFDGMLIRPNKGVLGRAVASKMRMHPKVVAAVYGNGGNAATGGVVPLAALADLLELDEIIVPDSQVNTAVAGQTASYSRIWGKHASFIYQNPSATPRDGVTFGLTAEWGNRVSGTWEDPNVGLKGGTRGKVGEYTKELVLCNDVGYLFTNAVA